MERVRSLARRLRNPAVALAVLGVSFTFTEWWDFRLPEPGRAQYQAVFLTSGQVYFGRYVDRVGGYVRVDDAVYVRALTQPSSAAEAPPQSQLVRRGYEPHQPLPRILVSKSAILFVEDLQPGSPVARFMDQNPR